MKKDEMMKIDKKAEGKISHDIYETNIDAGNFPELPCDIVRDLLPLYHDNIVSDLTHAAVEKHLSWCAPCQEEYRALCLDLSADQTPVLSTKEKFALTMKKAKKKNIIRTALIAALSCTVLLGSGYVLTQVPLVAADQSGIELVRAYRYESGGKTKFFLLYEFPIYFAPTYGSLDITHDGGAYTLDFDWKIPVIASKAPDNHKSESTWCGSIGTASGEDPCTELYFGDHLIWSEAENGSAEVPAYVYAYEDMMNDNGLVTWESDLDAGYLGGEYEDGRRVFWTLDGELVYDEYPNADGEYPEFELEMY